MSSLNHAAVRLAAGCVFILISRSVSAQTPPMGIEPALYEDLARFAGRNATPGEPLVAVALDCDFVRHASVEHVIVDEEQRPSTLFTSVETDWSGYHLFPNIVSRNAQGVWTRTAVTEINDGWTHIHKDISGQNIIALMERIPESAGWETRFVTSADGGATWSYGASIRKYAYFNIVTHFQMSDAGIGVAVEYYGGGTGDYDAVGAHVYRTENWGRTWTSREYDPDHDLSGYDDVADSLRSVDRRPLSAVDVAEFDTCEPDGLPTRRSD